MLRTVRPTESRVALACVLVIAIDASTSWINNDLAVLMADAVGAVVVDAVVSVCLTGAAVEASLPTVTAKLELRDRFIIYADASVFAELSMGRMISVASRISLTAVFARETNGAVTCVYGGAIFIERADARGAVMARGTNTNIVSAAAGVPIPTHCAVACERVRWHIWIVVVVAASTTVFAWI